MQIINRDDRDKIIDLFNQNKILVLETDTVFGIMARASLKNERRINLLKNRDVEKHVAIIFPTVDDIVDIIKDVNDSNLNYLKSHLPGKYSFIVHLNNFRDYNRDEFGVRVTSSSYLQDIIKEVGPVCATSVNKTGEDILTNIDDIINVFGDEDIYVVESDIILDKASTIVNLLCDDMEVLR